MRQKLYQEPPKAFSRQYTLGACKGVCLEPLVPGGSTCYSDTEAGIEVGDLVTAWFRKEAFDACGQTRIKIVLGLTADTITLAALNPPQTITFRRSAFDAMHKVFAIQTPDGCVWDLRTAEGRQHFHQRPLIGMAA
jgi:hypothetical protein